MGDGCASDKTSTDAPAILVLTNSHHAIAALMGRQKGVVHCLDESITDPGIMLLA